MLFSLYYVRLWYTLNGDPMKCYQCRTQFYPKRTLKTLLNEPLSLRCPSCDRRYPRFFTKTVIPIEGFLLYHYTIFDQSYPIKEEAFLDEALKFILIYLQKHIHTGILIWKDELDSALFECLESLNQCDIFLICLFPSKLMI